MASPKTDDKAVETPTAAVVPQVVTIVQPPPPLPELTPPPANLDEAAWGGFDHEDSGSFVVNAEEGWVYSWIRPADYPADGRELQALRQKSVTRGFEPVSGPYYKGAPRLEYVQGRPDLELWRIKRERWDNEWRVDMARQVLDSRAAQRYWRHHVKENAPRRGRGGLPQDIENMMLAYHGLVSFPGNRAAPTRDEIIARVRRMPVHPGSNTNGKAW